MENNFEDYFRKTFLATLRSQITNLVPGREERIEKEIESRFPAITQEPQNKALIKDNLSKTHLATCSLVLAAYRILSDVLKDPDRVLEIIEQAFLEPARGFIPQLRAILENTPDAFKMAVEASKDKEVHFYGETFIFERSQDSETAYFLEVKQCFYHDFFTANQASEMTPIFCKWDNITAEVILEGNYNFQFERPETIGHGAEACRFSFQRR